MKTFFASLTLLFALSNLAMAEVPKFRMQEIDTKLGIGYAVSIVDVNADGKPDIVVVDTNRVIWYENPTWKMHTLIEDQTKKDNVCIVPYEIEGKGKLGFALGADWRPSDTLASGSIQWLSPGEKPDDKWIVHPIGTEPTVHRMRAADLDGSGRKQLIVAPLQGRGTTSPKFAERPVRLLSYTIPKDPVHDEWKPEVINEEFHALHNIWPVDWYGNGKTQLLTASFEGVHLIERTADGKWKTTHLGEGNQVTSPNRGSSEIKLGQLEGGQRYLATIEPWHGFQVVVYTKPLVDAVSDKPGEPTLWTRNVLDEKLQWGHAVWCASLDGGKNEHLIIGVRDDKDAGNPCGLRIYEPVGSGADLKWEKHVVDPGGVAIEDLTAADLNGDGRIDIIAVGRKTKNVRIYWNEGK